MKFSTLSILLLVCLTLSAPIFSMETEQEKILWQQLYDIYENDSQPIIQLFYDQRPDVEFEKVFDEWKAIAIAYKILNLEQDNITSQEVIDFSIRKLGQFLAYQEYAQEENGYEISA